MKDVLQVDELDAFAYLAHENGARSLREHEVVVDHALKQLAALDSANENCQCLANRRIYSSI